MPGRVFRRGVLWGKEKPKATERVDIKHELKGKQSLRFSCTIDAIRIGLEPLLKKRLSLENMLDASNGFSMPEEDIAKLPIYLTGRAMVGLPEFDLEHIVDQVSGSSVELKLDDRFRGSSGGEKYDQLKGLLQAGYVPMLHLEREVVFQDGKNSDVNMDGKTIRAAHTLLVNGVREREGKRYVKVFDIHPERWGIVPDYEIPMEMLNKSKALCLKYLMKKKQQQGQ